MRKSVQMAVIGMLVALWGGVSFGQGYFEETFGGSGLDARWTVDNSPANVNDPNYNNVGIYPDGNPSVILVDTSAHAATAPVTHQEAYNHLQTPIDVTGEFYVQASLRVDLGMGSGSSCVAVYWDEINYVILKWGRGFLRTIYSDGQNYYEATTAEQSAGWEMQTLKLEFTADTIKCYAKHGSQTSLAYWPVLDIPRGPAFQQAGAILVVGKGLQSPSMTNPDLDNDEAVVGGNDSLTIDNIYYLPLGYEGEAPEFFVEAFDGPELDARWSAHNSPSNVEDANYAGGSDIRIENGQAVAYPTHQEAYNHLATPIDGSKNFAVQITSRINHGMGAGSNHLVVYWDYEHWISLQSGKYQYAYSSVHNDLGWTQTNTGRYSEAWEMITLRMEFREETIEFFVSDRYTGAMVHWPALDRARDEWTRKPMARMIIGKGEGAYNTLYPNPAFQNDDIPIGVADQLIMDNAKYEPLDLYVCGDPNTVYLDSDLNRDCAVDMGDLQDLAGRWLWCSDPSNAQCDPFWKSEAYFFDWFDTGVLHERWTEDNSPANPAGSEFTFWQVPQWLIDIDPFYGFGGGWQLESTAYMEAYHHVETTIAASANFSVETSIRSDGAMGTGAPHLAVYWDATHYVDMMAPTFYPFAREYNDGSGNELVYDSTLGSLGGWNWYQMKMEFTDTSVKFYAGIKAYPDALTYLPPLEIARPSWMTGEALLIAGRGKGVGVGPDFDNDETALGPVDSWIAINYVGYSPLGVISQCGDPGAVHFAPDMDDNCYVDLYDYAAFVQQWLWCTDPARPECDSYWR